MSHFVNYNKRSVTLPPGCKNLIDLLRPTELPKDHATPLRSEQPTVTRGESFTGRLSEIGKYVAMVFQARAEMVILLLSTPDDQLTMNLGRDQSGAISASVVFGHEADRERAVRAFYARHGLETPQQSGIPEHFSAHLPVQCIYPVSPLPPESALISDMATSLFRDVCGLDDNADLGFRYYEVTNEV